MTAESPRAFFRLLQTDSLTRQGFMSHEALGTPPRRPLSRREQDLWRGVSVHDSFEAACAKGTVSPWLGQYVAEIRIPHDVAVRIEQTGRDRSHYTIWADPDALLSWMVSVLLIHPVH
jgi:hypothetical protein